MGLIVPLFFQVDWTASRENTIHDNQVKIRMTFPMTVHFIRMFAMLEHDVLIAKNKFEGGVNPLDGSLTNLIVAACHW